MLSRSHILVEKELVDVVKADLWGIDVSLINDNLYEWSARIKGLIGTSWEGAIFRVYLKFDEHYNVHPPRVCFHTIPYHPNIDMITGRPCIDYLDDCEKWSDRIKISSVLLLIQSMLGNPDTNHPINVEAADMLNNSPETYRKIVSECVEYSQQIDNGGLLASKTRQYSLQNIPEPAKVESSTSPAKDKRTTKLSFDDYFAQWNGLATSKPSPLSINTYLETIKDDAWMKQVHYAMTEEERINANLEKQAEYGNLYYGSLNQDKAFSKERSGRDSKLAKINQMRKIYLPKKPLPTPRSPTRPQSDSEGEAENLVAWTQNLNADELDAL